MEYGIPEEIIEEVRVRTDIVEIISEYVTLQRKGKNHLGLCPFHAEKTPSFTVTPEKQIFYCFGCHVGGNVFSFLMKRENWTFIETVRHLAHRSGVSLPERELSATERKKRERRRRWEEIHEWAAAYFQEILLEKPEGEAGRRYLHSRGLDEQTIRSFRLGYAPPRWDGLIKTLSEHGVTLAEMVEAGLALEAENSGGQGGRVYDRFRNRVIFSILDSSQRPVAFGGRVLDDSLPKYLNSPETEFFSKGQHLYGMHRAHQGIREQGFALLVEGYMDVIAMQKAGYPNAVASLGTALTKDQAKLLRRYTNKIMIGYDADAAGVQAAVRAGEILRDVGLAVQVLQWPDGKDPDEFLRKHGAQEITTVFNNARTFIEFKYNILSGGSAPRSIPEKAELISKLAPDIIKVTSPAEREGYERFLGLELGLTLEAVQSEILRQEQKKPKNGRESENSRLGQDISVKNRDNIIRYVQPASAVPMGIYRAEIILLRLMFEFPRFIARFEEELNIESWKLEEHKEIYRSLCAGGLGSQADLPENTQGKLAAIMLDDIDLTRPEQLFEDSVRRIKSGQTEEDIADLQERLTILEKSGDLAGAMVLLREIGERLRRGE